MSIQPVFERFAAPLEKKYTARSSADCRLTGAGSEIARILCVHATVTCVSAEAGENEVRYTGRLYTAVVYEDARGTVCRIERGAEFSKRADAPDCKETDAASVTLSVLSVSPRREGNSIFISANIGAEIAVRSVKEVPYLTGGNGLILQQREIQAVKSAEVTARIEADDEFETGYVGDVLLHSENVIIDDAECSAGTVIVSGEINLQICALKDDGLCSYERLIPFRREIPCEDAFRGKDCDASVTITSSNVTAVTDEGRNNCTLTCEITAEIRCRVYETVPLRVATDVFSPLCETEKTMGVLPSGRTKGYRKFTEHIAGLAALDGEIDFSCNLQAVALQSAEVNAVMHDSAWFAEGTASATLLFADSDGGHRSAAITLPFSAELAGLRLAEGESVTLSAIVCGLSARQKQEGRIDAEGTLRISARIEETSAPECVTEVKEGKAYTENTNAVSVFLPQAGDDLWAVAKKLGKAPDEVLACNPELTFPVESGRRIVIYRKI